MRLFLLALPLLLYAFWLGTGIGDPSPTVLLTLNPDVVRDEEGASSFPEEAQHQKTVQDLSGISVYTPVKSCHTNLSERHGEFSPPLLPNSFEGNIWCNWTIWAGSQQHIVIYIKGFQSGESCDMSGDKIFFHGVSSLAESTVIYACWWKEAHVFATYARGVHVVLLLRHSARPRKERLVGKYYVFKHLEMKTSPKGAAGSSEILVPELSRSVLTGLPQSEKEAFLSMWDRRNASLSASHKTDPGTELSQSSPARRGEARAADLPSFVWQVTSDEYLNPASPGLLPTSSTDNGKLPCSPETSMEMTGLSSWGRFSESATPSDVFSYIPCLSLSPLISPSSPTDGPALPSASRGDFITDDPQIGSKLTQLDYLALAVYSPALSHSLEATPEGDRETACSHSVEEVISTNFQKGVPVPKGVSRGALGFETASLPSPEWNWIRTEVQDGYFHLPSKISEQDWPSRLSGSPWLIFSSHYMSEWEIRTAPIPEESTLLLDTKFILESSVGVIDLLATNCDVMVSCDSPGGRWPPQTRSSPHEAFSTMENVSPVATEFITHADVSLNLAAEMPSESQQINWEGQRSYFLDRETKPELSFFLDEATMASIISTETEFSIFSQDHDLSLKIKPTLPFPSTELEPSHSHNSKATLLLAIPDREPTPSAVDRALSPSMVLNYPFLFMEPDRVLSLPELNPLVLSEAAQALSLAVERPGPVTSQLECACGETAAILQTATELENVLSPSAVLLELAVPPTATLNSLANELTMSAFPPVNEITSSLGLLTANAVKTVNSLSSCCQHVASASGQEDLSLLTVQPSGSVDPVVGVLNHSVSAALAAAELKHLFPATKTVFTKQRLSEGQNNVYFVTVPEEEDEGALCSDTVGHFNLLSETERSPSLSGFTANGQSPQYESVTETPLVFVPVTGEEKRVMNYAFISSTALTSVLSHTEMQTRAAFLSPFKAADDATTPVVQPQGHCKRQPSAKWQKTTLEMTVASLNVPGAIVKAVPQKNTAAPQTPQPPSDTENKVVSHVLWSEIELGFPWLKVYLPVKSCHITLMDEAGTFSPPTFSSIQTNNWCNWTIWAGPDKHILIYIEGFEGKPDCEENQDKILFQGVMSSVENKITYACQNHGTLIFATQAVAAHVVFLSRVSSQNHGPTYFKGRYYIFEDYEMLTSTGGDMVPEEPVLKSNSSIGFPSYRVHSRHISDFEKTGRIPSNENSQPMSSKGRWNKTNNASSLETLLGQAVSNYAPVSFSKPTANILDMKKMHTVKSSADKLQTGNDTLAGSLKKTVVLGSSGLEDKEKAILPSATPYESQKLITRPKLVAAGISTMSAGLENNGHAPIRWRPKYVKDASRAKFERSGFLSGVTFPQISVKERGPPISPAKSITEESREQVLQPWQSYAEISKEVSNTMEFQHVEMKEGAGGEQTDSRVMREGNGDQYVAVADGAGKSKSSSTELLSVNMPDKSTMKPKPHLTTLAHPNVFHVISSLNILNSDLNGIATTSHSQVVLPGNVFVFRSKENDSILESQHKPGDVLLEVTFSIEHKGWIPQHGSELEEDLIRSVKMQVQERVEILPNKVKEIKLKEIKRKGRSERKRVNDPDLTFIFWLHLVPEEKNISHFIHSQLESLGGISTGSGKIRQVSVGDVNECSSGIELCGDGAICLNGYGTYFCQCQEEYEDQSLTRSGTLCVRVPPTGLHFLSSYMEIFVGTMIFFIAVIIVVISILCTILRKRHTKKDLSFPEAPSSKTPAASHSQPVAFNQNNLGNLLTLDPACLKLRAKSPEWPLKLGGSPTEDCRVSVEQSECF